ncbi:MAG: response regulator [Lachnospiraceae bacterium]|nr:response regulator [Lachnospiraceae bacterium]
MLNLAIFVQILATIICLASVLVVAYKKPSSYSNVIIITFLCSFVQNGAYILELVSTNAGEGMMAVKAEYLGGAFEIGLITFFMFKYCGHEFNKVIQGILISEGIFVLLGVWTWEYNHIYYTGVRFVNEGAIPHLSMDHGWLYFVFAGTTVIELIACIFILTVSILKTSQKHMRYNYIVLMVVAAIPLVLYVVSVTGVFGGYDATPISTAMAVGIFSLALLRNHVFDVADAEGERILANLENGIIIVNNDGGYEYSNNTANSLFPALKSYKRGDIIREVEIRSLFDKKREGQISIGNRQFDVNVNSVKTDNYEIGTTVLLYDITEAGKQIEQMKKLMDEAEEANIAKSSFLAKVSHEIRTPINVVMGMTEILLRDHSTDTNKEYLNNIRNSSTTLLDLISDILDFSKMESGKFEIVSERFDLLELLEQLLNVYEFRCAQRGLEFKYYIDKDIPRQLIGDEIRVRQVATNLLSNAVKYTDEGYVKFKLGFKYRSDFDIDLIMAIEDSGRGISREDYDKLFAGLGRNNMRVSTSDQGTGLGLNITKNLVEMMGGLLNFKSEVGRGTIFSAVIPLVAASDSNQTVGEIKGINVYTEYEVKFTAPEAEILVVDDSPISIKVIRELLKPLEAKVSSCTSGDECLQRVREKHYDLIFMDHRMPSMDGVETFSRIKQSENECHGVPVVMVTANATKDTREYYMGKGFADFLLKPVNTAQLASMLYKYLPEYMINMK